MAVKMLNASSKVKRHRRSTLLLPIGVCAGWALNDRGAASRKRRRAWTRYRQELHSRSFFAQQLWRPKTERLPDHLL